MTPLEQMIETLKTQLTPSWVLAQVQVLMREGQDVGGGINAFRLMRHLLGKTAQSDADIRRAYEQLKPFLRAALSEIPSLYYFEGD